MENIRVFKALILTSILTQSFLEYRAQGISRCGTTEYSVSAGYISSPGFPSAYANNLNCTYNLKATGQNSLTVLYETIDLEFSDACSFDWVQIWCSSNFSNREKSCGIGQMRSISYARCNHAVIQFRTDSSNTGRGFNFSYAFKPIGLGLHDVRLNYTTSSNSREGRLEINFNGTWGTVCDRGFTNASARVACARLGFGYVGTVTKNSHGRGSGPIWFDGVSCFGTEQSIDECSHSAWRSHNCSHYDDVSINCALGIRLKNTRSSNPTEGRLEVNYNGTWGTVCDYGFTHINARVACASLGFGYIGGFIGNSHGAGTGPIWLYYVSCTGNEYGLDGCIRRAFGLDVCSHNNDVSINCSPASCGKTEYSDATGFISSPGFPTAYGDNLNCTYSIKRSDQDSVTIMFPVFYMYDRTPDYYYGPNPCLDYNWVEVQCADEWHKPNIRRYCGYNRPPALEFKSCDHVILRFHIKDETLQSAFQVTYGFKPAAPEVEIFAYSGMPNRSDIGQNVTCPESSRQCNSSRHICSSYRNLCCEIYNRSTSDEYCMCQIGYGGRSCAESNSERSLLHFEVIETTPSSFNPTTIALTVSGVTALIVLLALALAKAMRVKSRVDGNLVNLRSTQQTSCIDENYDKIDESNIHVDENYDKIDESNIHVDENYDKLDESKIQDPREDLASDGYSSLQRESSAAVAEQADYDPLPQYLTLIDV